MNENDTFNALRRISGLEFFRQAIRDGIILRMDIVWSDHERVYARSYGWSEIELKQYVVDHLETYTYYDRVELRKQIELLKNITSTEN